MRQICFGAAIVSVLLSGPAAAFELADLTAECDSCHGPDGVSATAEIPTIAGQTAEFIDDALHSYQVWGRPCVKSPYPGDDSRPKTTMCKIAGGLSAEDIDALAGHYSALPFRTAAQEFDAGQVEAGAALHAKSCETCHQEGGSKASRGPILAGQWTPYLKSTLKYVPTGEHMVPPMMERGLEKFSPEEISALLNFYASQQD